MTTTDRNLITLFRGYYRIGIHHYIGTSGHAMFTGLLYKFNELNFPDSVKISVNEMLSLSGITDVRTFRNARNKLTNYLHTKDDPESWVVKYTEGEIKEYGSYELNYVILLEYYCNITVELQESYSKKSRLTTKIDPYVDPKSAKNALPSNTIQEDTIQDISTTDDFSEKRKRVEQIVSKYFTMPSLKFRPNDITVIAQYSDEQINNVVSRADSEQVMYAKVPGYILRGLEHYAEWYNNEKPDNITPTPYKQHTKEAHFQKVEENRAMWAKVGVIK